MSQLRKSLSAAEQDVIRRQEEMETLRQQLATPTIEVETSGNWYGFFFVYLWYFCLFMVIYIEPNIYKDFLL